MYYKRDHLSVFKFCFMFKPARHYLPVKGTIRKMARQPNMSVNKIAKTLNLDKGTLKLFMEAEDISIDFPSEAAKQAKEQQQRRLVADVAAALIDLETHAVADMLVALSK